MTDNFERALQERLLARSQVSPRDVEALRLYARTLPAKRGVWRMPALQWGLTAAAVVLAAVVALPALLNLPGFGGDASPTPTAPATPAPTAPAPTPAVPTATVAPTLPAGMVGLLTASGSEVIVRISDPDEVIEGARAEQAEATMSVRWFDSIVESVPPTGIRITWVGFARDEDVRLEVTLDGSGVPHVHIVQQAPPPASDGEGEDRILVLELDRAVDPADVEVTFDYPA